MTPAAQKALERSQPTIAVITTTGYRPIKAMPLGTQFGIVQCANGFSLTHVGTGLGVASHCSGGPLVRLYEQIKHFDWSGDAAEIKARLSAQMKPILAEWREREQA